MNKTRLILFRYLIAFFIAGLFSIPFAFIAFGSDLTTQKSPLYPYQSSIEIQDDFVVGFPTSTVIGTLNWITTGGAAPTYIAPEAGRPGLVRRDTSAVINTVTTIQLSPAQRAFLASETFTYLYIARLNTNDANTQVRIGVQGAAAGNPDANGIYLEKLDADTNWFCVSRAAGVQTRTDSGVAVSTSFFSVRVTKNSSGVQFAINNTNVCDVISTNVPTLAVLPVVQIVNSAAASKTIDLDYFELKITGLSR